MKLLTLPCRHPSHVQVDPSVLAWFDSDGEEKLIHFRFLPAERRAAAAQYIMQQNLDASVSWGRVVWVLWYVQSPVSWS
jgi:hypothetical protein